MSANSERREHVGINASFENASGNNNTLGVSNVNGETRHNIPDEVSELSVQKHIFTGNHTLITAAPPYFPSTGETKMIEQKYKKYVGQRLCALAVTPKTKNYEKEEINVLFGFNTSRLSMLVSNEKNSNLQNGYFDSITGFDDFNTVDWDLDGKTPLHSFKDEEIGYYLHYLAFSAQQNHQARKQSKSNKIQ